MGAPIRSMTGFGAATRGSDGLRIFAEVRAVNHRYLKISAYLPEELAWAQSVADEQVRGRIGRGAVSVTVAVERTANGEAVEIDTARLKRLYQHLDGVRRELKLESPISLGDLLAVSGVIRAPEAARVDAEPVRRSLVEAIDAAIDGLDAMQLREGALLHDELRSLVATIHRTLESLEAELPETARASQERYVARIRDLVREAGVEIAPGDLVREVAILAEKADISEEASRLRGHLQQFREALDEGGRVGRKLDFLTQEMFREANTMGAKVTRQELARRVMEIKADVDRLREQAQNVE